MRFCEYSSMSFRKRLTKTPSSLVSTNRPAPNGAHQVAVAFGEGDAAAVIGRHGG